MDITRKLRNEIYSALVHSVHPFHSRVTPHVVSFPDAWERDYPACTYVCVHVYVRVADLKSRLVSFPDPPTKIYRQLIFVGGLGTTRPLCALRACEAVSACKTL